MTLQDTKIRQRYLVSLLLVDGSTQFLEFKSNFIKSLYQPTRVKGDIHEYEMARIQLD